jgi:hypothetical protein
MFIMPSPVSVQPEDGLLFRHYNFFFVHAFPFFILIIWGLIPDRLPLFP